MRIKRACRWEMNCPYCGTSLIFDRSDVTCKTFAAKDYNALDIIDRLVYRKQKFDSDCITCIACGDEIQLGILEESHNYPIWTTGYEEISYDR